MIQLFDDLLDEPELLTILPSANRNPLFLREPHPIGDRVAIARAPFSARRPLTLDHNNDAQTNPSFATYSVPSVCPAAWESPSLCQLSLRKLALALLR